MFGKWYQLYVKAPQDSRYTTPQSMQEVNKHLMYTAPASFVAPDNLPQQEPDGTWEVRVHNQKAVDFVKYLLTTRYKLELVREVEHDDTTPTTTLK